RPTTTVITSDLPDPSDRLQAVTVTYSVTDNNGGPAPGGTVTVSISGGSETCTASVAAGQCSVAWTTPGAGQTVTTTYRSDNASLTSSGTATHTVNPCPATPVVTSTADSGAGTLRQAIADACATDSITFSLGGAAQTITLTSGELVIGKNLTITGPGAALLTL